MLATSSSLRPQHWKSPRKWRAKQKLRHKPLIRLKVIDFLEEAGFDVIEAAYGDEAFDLVGDHSTHLIFTDMQMPGNLKGFDLAHNVARRFPDAVSSLQEGWRRKIWSCRPTPNSSPSPYDLNLGVARLNAVSKR